MRRGVIVGTVVVVAAGLGYAWWASYAPNIHDIPPSMPRPALEMLPQASAILPLPLTIPERAPPMPSPALRTRPRPTALSPHATPTPPLTPVNPRRTVRLLTEHLRRSRTVRETGQGIMKDIPRQSRRR